MEEYDRSMLNTNLIRVCRVVKQAMLNSDEGLRAMALSMNTNKFVISEFEDDWMQKYVISIEVNDYFVNVLFDAEVLTLGVYSIEKSVREYADKISREYHYVATEPMYGWNACVYIDRDSMEKEGVGPYEKDTVKYFDVMKMVLECKHSLKPIEEPVYFLDMDDVALYLQDYYTFTYNDYSKCINNKKLGINIDVRFMSDSIVSACDAKYYILSVVNVRIITAFNRWCHSVIAKINTGEKFNAPIYVYVKVRSASEDKLRQHYDTMWRDKLELFGIHVYIGEKEKHLFDKACIG